MRTRQDEDRGNRHKAKQKREKERTAIQRTHAPHGRNSNKHNNQINIILNTSPLNTLFITLTLDIQVIV